MKNVNTNFADSPYITYKLENSLVVAVFKKDVKIDLEIAKQIVHQRLSFQNGNDYLNLADARNIKGATKEARDYLAKQDKGLIAAAIVGENLISNIIVNMFITFSRPRVPVKAFQDKENALKWLSQFDTENKK